MSSSTGMTKASAEVTARPQSTMALLPGFCVRTSGENVARPSVTWQRLHDIRELVG